MTQETTSTTETPTPEPQVRPTLGERLVAAAKNSSAPKKRAEETKARRQAAIKKAQEARAVLNKQRELVKKKVEMGLPITDEENKLLRKGMGHGGVAGRNQRILTEAAKIINKPKDTTELRILVEEVVRRKSYNPVEDLIALAQGGTIKDSDKIAIHKTLLPYCVPQLPPAPKEAPAAADTSLKVQITRFEFPEHLTRKPEKALHTEKPTTVTTTPSQ